MVTKSPPFYVLIFKKLKGMDLGATSKYIEPHMKYPVDSTKIFHWYFFDKFKWIRNSNFGIKSGIPFQEITIIE